MLKRIIRLIAGLVFAGLLLTLVAPAASAASTYDITDVGDAEIVSVKTDDGRELSDQTINAYGWYMTLTMRIDIDDMSTLAEGDTVDVRISYDKDSYFKPWFFSSTNMPASLKDGAGHEIFMIQPKSDVLRLVRTGEPAVGSFSTTISARNQMFQPDSGTSTTSTWHVGKNSTYRFSNQPWKYTPCTSNAIQFVSQVDNGLVSLVAAPYNCATVTKVATGADLSGISGDDLLFWFRLTPESGRMVSSNAGTAVIEGMKTANENAYADQTADSKSMASLTRTEDVDASTFAKAKANLKYGTYYSGFQSDGSYIYAINYGSRLPGRANSLRLKDSADSDATLRLMEKTDFIWPKSWSSAYVHFADESIPNRVKVEMQSTEDAYQTKTLTTKPIEPPIGQGQSAIRYDPNGGDGDAFKKVGDPGTASTTAEAGVFLRQGYTFAGWNTAKDGTGTSYAAGAAIAYPAEGDTTTLYAQWTPIAYKVRFDGNSATSGTMADLTATYDAKASLPANRYAKAGYTFAGWNTKPDGSGTSYKDKADIVNLSSTQDDVVVLYAQWRGLVTVLPNTGGHATHAPLIVGGIVTAAALALAVTARRRVGRHANPPV